MDLTNNIIQNLALVSQGETNLNQKFSIKKSLQNLGFSETEYGLFLRVASTKVNENKSNNFFLTS